MSRRPPNPAAERAAQNQQTIKSLLKLEANKVCADCKRNKPTTDPRWASWNLGVFICIRCSGIHRGMGTHISRVKSVDLDSWTDEQLQSILSWGNARANKYWEAKLAPGHVPSEAKIENFIRTKYELKRWTMDGPIPDPATLDAEGDDDVPLSIVKEKQNIERKESIRKQSVGKSAAPQQADLIGGIGGDPIPQRASTAGPPPTSKVPPKAEPAPPKATSTKDSLLGLDFLGTETAAPPRPASTTGTSGSAGQSRPDLKQSILSLYATAPRPQAQAQPQQSSHAPSGSFSGMQSPAAPQQPSAGLTDAFSGLSFSSSSGPKSPQSSAFAGLGNFSSSRPAPQSNNSAFSNLSGGSFFDSKPAAPVASQQPKPTSPNYSAFSSPTLSAAPPKPAAAPAPASAALGDLFDFSSPAQPAAAPAPAIPNPMPSASATSVFNLSASQPKSPVATSPPAAQAANPMASLAQSSAAWGGSDVWGGNAWSTPDTTAAAPSKSPEATKATPASDFNWGSSTGNSFANQSVVPGASGGLTTAPKVTADEEFGGWASSTGSSSKPAASFGGNNEDLFGNVWQ
ncbi:uncharacterized protein E0L32_001464 [Thyridium curvatum]|uniref:Arf-GAP domain-containing protein n=1 Tax=Thyridium curvatum TaxID=1093900 RepID=A0A507AS17_9PEZI|nr:uncharacterized protein E0L32_001464 [Thyridium curvatum]TPX10267.1 hypothetical protein E0L32_001464 [Thyridium curvatum]